MGIKHLWTILTPFGERKPLYELQGKKVAVDLSCWICEAQNIAEYEIQPRMYLRNLYFRTTYLLLMDVHPVFVLEGKAPELKYQTISARNAIQFKGARPKNDKLKTGKDRTRFNFTLRQCQEMLNLLGVSCIKGNGEAEALCAYLNEDGFVDGCISQDSDCFAYGAKVVYRNFSISQQGPHSSSGGSVDVYDITKAFKSINFGRNKIITLALLCGSDYNDGVFGVGKDSAMKLFDKVGDTEILDRVRSWRKSSIFEEFEKQLSDKNICTSCGHLGRLQSHNKNGCTLCKTTRGCDFSKYKEQRQEIKNEINMRNKAVADPNFPDESLINEFLSRTDKVADLDLKWKRPDLAGFVKFASKYLQWEKVYSFEKCLPILTRWQLLHFDVLTKNETIKGVVFAKSIKKIRNPKGVPSYEMLWSDTQEYFKNLVPQEQLDSIENLEKFWSTIEPQHLVDKAHPALVESFKQSKIKPKKQSKRKGKTKSDVDCIADLMKNTSLSEPKVKKPRQRKKKETVNGKDKVKTIDSYFKKAVLNAQMEKDQRILNVHIEGDQAVTSTPLKQKEYSATFDFDMSRFGDENDSDLSDIIEGITSQKIANLVHKKLDNLGLQILSDWDHEDEENQKLLNSSSFFIRGHLENDLFEQSLDEKYASDESTEEYEVDNEIAIDGNKNDTFFEEYVPLIDRLKTKS